MKYTCRKCGVAVYDGGLDAMKLCDVCSSSVLQMVQGFVNTAFLLNADMQARSSHEPDD